MGKPSLKSSACRWSKRLLVLSYGYCAITYALLTWMPAGTIKKVVLQVLISVSMAGIFPLLGAVGFLLALWSSIHEKIPHGDLVVAGYLPPIFFSLAFMKACWEISAGL